MALILGVALALGLSIQALEVMEYKDFHIHGWVEVREGRPYYGFNQMTPAPFWPRYLRKLAGLPWNKVATCGRGAGNPGESCEYAHAEMRRTYDGGVVRFRQTEDMQAAFSRILAK